MFNPFPSLHIYICIYIILYYTNIIYKTEDLIEREDIRHAKVAAKDAHVCVIVVNASDSTSVRTILNPINSISGLEIESICGSSGNHNF